MTRFSRNNIGNIDPASVATGGAMIPVFCFYFPFLWLLSGSWLLSARTGVEIYYEIMNKVKNAFGVSSTISNYGVLQMN